MVVSSPNENGFKKNFRIYRVLIIIGLKYRFFQFERHNFNSLCATFLFKRERKPPLNMCTSCTNPKKDTRKFKKTLHFT